MEKTIFNIVSTLMDEPLENISIDTGPSTISNWDSLRHMKLILATEEEFNIIFPDQALILITDVKTLCQAVTKLVCDKT
jgi:acyl carrier protein